MTARLRLVLGEGDLLVVLVEQWVASAMALDVFREHPLIAAVRLVLPLDQVLVLVAVVCCVAIVLAAKYGSYCLS